MENFDSPIRILRVNTKYPLNFLTLLYNKHSISYQKRETMQIILLKLQITLTVLCIQKCNKFLFFFIMFYLNSAAGH